MDKLKNDEIEMFLDFEIPNDSEASFCSSDDDDIDADNSKTINDHQVENSQELLVENISDFLGDMDSDIRFTDNNNKSYEPDGDIIIDEKDVYDFDTFFKNILLQTQIDNNRQTITESIVDLGQSTSTQTSNQILNPISLPLEASISPTNNKKKTSSSSNTVSKTNLQKSRLSNTSALLKSKNKKPYTLPKNVKKNIKQTKWFSGRDNKHINSTPTFTGNKSINVNVKGATPYSVFIQLFTEPLFELIRTETIKYAVQHGKDNFNLSMKELKVFFGINIAMTYIKYPNVRMYWSSQEGLKMNLIADAMTYNRFAEIKRFIHFADNYEKPQEVNDKYWKIRPVIDILHNSFHSAISTSHHIAIDEMMVPFKGRSSMKQYLKSKPKKWGFKIWVQAGTNGYVHCFELYQGALKNNKSLFGPIGETVLRLCHSIEGKNHKLFMDNLFTTVPLLRKLKSLNIDVLGTLRLNRVTGIENYLVKDKLLNRGNCSIATSDDNLTIVRWKDTKLVHTISTYAGAHPEDTTSRYDRKEKKRIEVTRPFSIREYNKFMGGVDLMDRMIAHYPHGFKNKKWYLRIFFIF